MLNLSLDKQLLIFINEVFDKRRLFASTFFIISITILIIGLSWPKWYESSTTLVWNEANALQPLLKGTAETNVGLIDPRAIRDIIFSNKILNVLIEKTGLNYSSTGEKLSDREIEILKAQLRQLILIELKRNNTIKISYKNTGPDLAFLVVSIISNLFIEESTLNKKTDSYDAYKFIEKLVIEYGMKLEEITKNINEFKRLNVGLQVDTSQSVNARVGNLKNNIKVTLQQLKEATIQERSLTEQLVIESNNRVLVEKANAGKERLTTLENRLNTLRLSYTETYPDIVQIKEQIKNLKRRMETDAKGQASDTDTLNSGSGNVTNEVRINSALYQQLQQQLSAISTTLRTLSARKIDQENQLTLELSRSGEVNLLYSELNGLSRDYEVTKKLYNDLLTKRENARISLSLDSENAGSLYKVQEPPTIPLVPHGLRFFHFAIGSIIAGVGLPLAIIFGLLILDPRIRHEDDFELGEKIPVIGVISNFQNENDLKKQRLATIQSVIIFSLSFIVLATLSLSRYVEVL